MLPVGSIASGAASAFGFMAAAIAVCGFLVQAPAALNRKEESSVRAAMVFGGLVGFAIAIAFLVISAIVE